jgi:hypothetical protein
VSTTTSDQSTATRYALLVSGAIPEQSAARLDPTVRPEAGVGGYSVVGALQALVQASLQRDGSSRTAWVSLSTVDLTGTYRLDFPNGSHRVDFTAAAASEVALIAAWVAAVNADSDVNTIVSAVVDPTDSTRMRLSWLGLATGIKFSTPSGTGVIEVLTEYQSADVLLLERANVRVTVADTTSTEAWASWQILQTAYGFDGAISLANGQGIRTLVPCPGRAALFVYVYNAAGHADDASGCTYTTPIGLVAPVVAT